MKYHPKNLLLLLFITCLASVTSAQMWTQLGSDFRPSSDRGLYGSSMSMPDASTVAIGAPDSRTVLPLAGHVQIFEWDASLGGWAQKGSDIVGSTAYDRLGTSVSMPDANTIAVGAPQSFSPPTAAGYVRIHEWNAASSMWVQKGTDIVGETLDDDSGCSVSMPDASTVAIGAIRNDGSGSDAGHVRVYTWTGSTWMQKGSDIDGESAEDYFGIAVSMPDANTVAIGAIRNDGSGSDAGHVRVYTWTGSTWMQKGSDIDGESADDGFGYTVSMPDANTVAIGAPVNEGAGTWSGHVRVYEWNSASGTWMQKGADIDGTVFSFFGYSVSMPDPNTFAAGARCGIASCMGYAKAFTWSSISGAWMPLGGDISGETTLDQAGWSVSMPNSSTVAIGAPYNEDVGTEAGKAWVYELTPTEVGSVSRQLNLSVSPNPSNGRVAIELGEMMNDITVSLFDLSGQLIERKAWLHTSSVEFETKAAAGVYLLKVESGDRTATLKLVVE